ncbi:MAG: methyl-accepting chemotaxis protein [Candidatus Neomarinimicrobiota bacterium]
MSTNNMSIKLKLITGICLVLAMMVLVGAIAYIKSSQYSELAEMTQFMIEKEVDHFKWSAAVKDLFIDNGEQLKVETDCHKCGLGKWYYAFIKSDEFRKLPDQQQRQLLAIEEPHKRLHETAITIGAAYKQRHQGLERQLQLRLIDHYKWATTVSEQLLANSAITVQTDPQKCGFGQWLGSSDCKKIRAEWSEFDRLITELLPHHEAIHESVIDINQAANNTRKIQIFNTVTLPELGLVDNIFSRIIELEIQNENAFEKAAEIVRTETEPALTAVLEVFNVALSGLQAEARQANRSMYTGIIVSLLVSVCLAMLINTLLIRATINPIEKLIVMIRDIAEGEGDLTRRLEINSRDELGVLSKWFNVFVEKVHNIVKQVRESAAQVASASQEISASSEQLASGAEEQQSQTSEVATSVEEMAATIMESSNNSNRALDSARQAAQDADQGGSVVQQTIAGMGRISTAVRTSAAKIEELGQHSEAIGKIVSVIDDIADQTNLLALNANIEAARAGEQGRGFAVVADEVRVLAERTTKATAEIAEMIKGIQSGTHNAVQAMNEGIEEVDQGVDLVGKAGQSLEQIIAVVNLVQEAINQIAVSAEEQSAGAEEISANVEGISTVTKQSANSAQQVASAAEQLSRETETLNTLVNQFKI